MSKETFKGFVRSHPTLVTQVNQGTTTWQKLYELYDLYGENNSVWNTYLKPVATATLGEAAVRSASSTSTTSLGDASIKEIFNMVKSMDLETVRKGVDGLQKAVGILQDLTTGKKQEQYQARPLYKHLED